MADFSARNAPSVCEQAASQLHVPTASPSGKGKSAVRKQARTRQVQDPSKSCVAEVTARLCPKARLALRQLRHSVTSVPKCTTHTCVALKTSTHWQQWQLRADALAAPFGRSLLADPADATSRANCTTLDAEARGPHLRRSRDSHALATMAAPRSMRWQRLFANMSARSSC